MATWEAKNMLTREQTCSMCDTRYRFNAEIKAESSENSYEAEMKLREKMRNEMVRDFSNDPVKCPGCQKMTPAMWRKAITKSHADSGPGRRRDRHWHIDLRRHSRHGSG
jgi:hypothetical protein